MARVAFLDSLDQEVIKGAGGHQARRVCQVCQVSLVRRRGSLEPQGFLELPTSLACLDQRVLRELLASLACQGPGVMMGLLVNLDSPEAQDRLV